MIEPIAIGALHSQLQRPSTRFVAGHIGCHLIMSK
jgi:hypothetical protein